MGKGIAAGMIIAVVAGMAVGYFLLPMVFPIQADTTRQTLFVDYQELYDAGSSRYGHIEDYGGFLNVSFTTQAGDWVLLTFSCVVEVHPSSSEITVHQIFLVFKIDGFTIGWGNAASLEFYSNSTDNYHFTMMCQYVKTDISAGPHEIRIEHDIFDAGTNDIELRLNTLTAQII
jgi:hypothetical protein